MLTTLTLTNAEAYHNLVYRLMDQGVPIKAVCVQAIFEGEVDASTVKHRLDVLNEVRAWSPPGARLESAWAVPPVDNRAAVLYPSPAAP